MYIYTCLLHQSIYVLQEDEGIVMAPSKFVPTVQEGFTTYASILIFHTPLPGQIYIHNHMNFTGVWQHRDETNNFLQKHDNEIVKEQKR